MRQTDKIYVAGHTGMVGSALVRALENRGYQNIIKITHKELDLTKQQEVKDFFEEVRPDYVFLAAARVGGIFANRTFPVEFLLENLLIQSNILSCSHIYGVKKLVAYGSSCMYPKNCSQPIKEEYLLTGELESTNEAYAMAKLAGTVLCKNYNKQYGTQYINLVPANLYGINDNYNENSSHVIPALMKKIHEARDNGLPCVEIWGTGKPVRDFLFADDLADASLYVMERYNACDIKYDYMNVGTGVGISIGELAKVIKEVIGYEGEIKFDSSKPDGMYKKILDVTKINKLGWQYSTDLILGIKLAYGDFIV